MLENLTKIYDSLFAALVAARDLENGEYRVSIRSLLSKVGAELEEAEREEMKRKAQEETVALARKHARRIKMEEVGGLLPEDEYW